MGGLQRAGRAGRAGGRADAALVQQKDQRLALDPLEHERGAARQAVLGVARQMCARDFLQDALRQPAAQGRELRPVLLHGFARLGQRGGRADDAGDVLRPGAQAVLLPAAVQARRQRKPFSHVKAAHALRPAEFVRGEREHVDAQLLDVDRHVPDRLHRVGVEQRARLVRGLRDRPDGHPGTDLVVRRHHAHEGGAFIQRGAHRPRGDAPQTVHAQNLRPIPGAAQGLRRAQNRVVLRRVGNQARAAFRCLHPHGRAQGPVIGFRAAGGEVDFRRLRAQRRGDGRACVVHGAPRPAAGRVGGGRVTELARQVRHHRLQRAG